jgi:hypothetical protein
MNQFFRGHTLIANRSTQVDELDIEILSQVGGLGAFENAADLSANLCFLSLQTKTALS